MSEYYLKVVGRNPHLEGFSEDDLEGIDFASLSKNGQSLSSNMDTSESTYISMFKRSAEAIRKAEKPLGYAEIGHYSCRESVLYYCRAISMMFSKQDAVAFPIVFTTITSFEKEYGGLIRQFGEKYLENSSSRIGVRVYGKNSNPVVYCRMGDAKESYMPHYWEFSFILYLIRNKAILEYCVKTSKAETYEELLIDLSEKFMENPEWSNSSNPALNLSLFAYALVKGGFSKVPQSEFANGPAGASIQYADEKITKK